MFYEGKNTLLRLRLLHSFLFLEGPASGGHEEVVFGLNTFGTTLSDHAYLSGGQETAAMMSETMIFIMTIALVSYLIV